VSLEHAAFTTLGSIALQGIRQADPRLGENVCVIGLGLLGQISVQMLKAGGCRVFGIDTIPGMVSLALQTGCHVAMARDDKDLDAAADAFTEGYGFDSVIITAGTRSNDPVELATKILKKKGLVVVVGAVSMSIPREPHFYQKELELKISCSYGPGRYDHSYEEEGHDYPYGYVRWTENRNMVAFVKLLESGSVDLKPLVTHVIDIGEAERAYDIVTGKIQEPHIALLLKYPETEEIVPKKYVEKAGEPQPQIGVGFIGAGSFAQKFLIPYAKECGTLMGVVTAHGVTAKNVSEKFNFRMSSTEKTDLLANPEVNTIFIATRHNLHAALTAAALEAGKNVFVEKPLATCDDDLSRIADVYRKKSQSRLMVGFNRRFASLVTALKGELRNSAGPLVINYRINAGFIPKEHWIQTEDGGGRIIGEVCHFVDLVQYLTDSVPENVFSECISSRNTKTFNQDDVVITIRLSKGSVAVITYLGSGAKALPKERVEVSGSGRSYVIDDFQEGLFYNDSDCRKIKTPGKGHREEVLAFMKSIKDGMPSPIPFESLLYTTAATFRIIDSLQTGLPQKVVIP
jgi:polar amino acid transport system substrate-binding protein